jgi:formamidopyrimidine-DNA glycosylase
VPELPEVETVRRELEPWLTHRTIVRARRADAPAGPKYAALERADGQRIQAVNRRGKFLLLPLSGGDELVIHLGMTGIVSPRPPIDHLRVVVELSGKRRTTLYFQDARRFGRFLVVRAGRYESLPTLDRMGPEPLSPAFTATHLHAAFRSSRAPVKAFIMTQRPVAGVGNIYADEALWRARIHPMTPARALGLQKAAELHGAIVDVLSAAIDAQGTTINDYRTVNGEVGAYLSELDAYGHEGEPCHRCGAKLRRIIVGQRSSCFCPRCQRRARAR